MKNPDFKTDMPVLLPVNTNRQNDKFQIKLWHGFAIFGFCLISSNYVFADDSQAQASALSILFKWMPLLLQGFHLQHCNFVLCNGTWNTSWNSAWTWADFSTAAGQGLFLVCHAVFPQCTVACTPVFRDVPVALRI